MSSLHLTVGSEQPAKVEGKLRLYSMHFCPYAHRVRLVLNAKNVPHDIVNVNLINKPEWLFKVHPEGKVPALDTGSKVIIESLAICDYLDETYPDPPLYPAEPAAKQQDKELIEKIAPLTSQFAEIVYNKDKKSAKDWIKELAPNFDIFEEELKKRGTKYFGGENPGMIDYMLWPWAERGATIAMVLGEKLPVQRNEYLLLRAWRKQMREHPIVDEIYVSADRFYKVILFKTAGTTPDYDSV